MASCMRDLVAMSSMILLALLLLVCCWRLDPVAWAKPSAVERRLRGRDANLTDFAQSSLRELWSLWGADSAEEPQRLFWLPIGGEPGHVVDEEGEGLAEVDGSFADCKKKCDEMPSCGSLTSCGGGKCFLKSNRLSGNEASHSNSYCSSYYRTADPYRPKDARLARPSDEAPTLTFYVYRAQGPKGPDGDYPLANVNVASMGGVMWYLHNEVIGTTSYDGKLGERRYGITRIRRFKITYKPTQPLIERKMNFGVKESFDFGMATGPFRRGADSSAPEWAKFGFYIGCNKLGEYPHQNPPFSTTGTKYPNAIWYSLPGPCPTMNYKTATDECNAELPGGLCSSPDGRGNCTYNAEDAGEIDIDELVGIKAKYGTRANFISKGCFEGDGHKYKNGWCIDFWNEIWNAEKNEQRVRAAYDMFESKYPDSAKREVPPVCDFDYKRYYA